MPSPSDAVRAAFSLFSMKPYRDPADAGALRSYRFGWYGDNGLGEALLQAILSGRKSASACPAYDPVEAREGETLRLVDKEGRTRGLVRVTRIETVRWGDFDEDLARKLGMTLEEARRTTAFANSRELRPDEEMRITHFALVP